MRRWIAVFKDKDIQKLAGNFSRKLSRKNFLERAAAGIAGIFAFALIKPASDAGVAFAHSSTPCYPPFGKFCSGCGSDSTCPSGFETCTSSNDYCWQGYCIYSSGWWYSASSSSGKHKCRDCQYKSKPLPCNGGNTDQCGCMSTTHY